MIQWLFKSPKRQGGKRRHLRSKKRQHSTAIYRTEQLECRRLLTELLPGVHGIPDFTADPTNVSVASGAWSDASVWSTGVTPSLNDIVLVSAGHHVSLDQHGVDVQAIGVRGTLSTSAVATVDEIVVYAEGVFNMGTGTEIIIADNPIDLDSDPLQWGNGIIVQGTWNAFGDDTTPYVRATHDISAGDTSFVADVVPLGWKPGDLLVLPETAQTAITKDGGQLNHSETVTIQSIDGHTVRFENAAKFDHLGISPNPFGVERYAHIGNLTRSITIRSENPEGTRGHTVATHHATVDLNNVVFEGMGRTSADRPIDDAQFAENGNLLHVGNNQSGRYSFHTHHLHGTYALDGLVVKDGLKWGITIHETDGGSVTNSIVYDVDGAGIVTESGEELDNGFIGNLVIKVDGGYQLGDHRGGVNRMSTSMGLVVDIAADGSGFWFRGPGNFVEDNAVYDSNGYGYNYNGYYRSGDPVQLRSFSGNEVASSLGGLWATWSQTGSGVHRFFDQTFEDFLAWHISEAGVLTYHDANITLNDFTIVNNPNASSANEGSHFIVDARATIGLDFGNPSYENHDFVLNNVNVSGANIGLLVPVNAGEDGAVLTGGTFRNYINIAYANGAELAETAIKNVAFLPTYVKQVSNVMPESPTDIWHSTIGVIDPGAVATGNSGAAGNAPIVFPSAVRLLDDGRLKIEGSDGDNVVILRMLNSQIQLVVDGFATTIDASRVSKIWFIAGAGDDYLQNDTAISTFADGGAGDDQLYGGSFSDSLYGGEGNDIIKGNDGNDLIYGGNGNDTLFGNAGNDKLRGEGGDDLLFGGIGSDPILSGGSGNDRIDGGAGEDVLSGDDGSDLLFGGSGHDSLHGGSGNDLLFGESGNDILYGGDGDDEMLGGGGVDRYRPGNGYDHIFAAIDDILFSDPDDNVRLFDNAQLALQEFGQERLIELLTDELLLTPQDALERALASWT